MCLTWRHGLFSVPPSGRARGWSWRSPAVGRGGDSPSRSLRDPPTCMAALWAWEQAPGARAPPTRQCGLPGQRRCLPEGTALRRAGHLAVLPRPQDPLKPPHPHQPAARLTDFRGQGGCPVSWPLRSRGCDPNLGLCVQAAPPLALCPSGQDRVGLGRTGWQMGPGPQDGVWGS